MNKDNLYDRLKSIIDDANKCKNSKIADIRHDSELMEYIQSETSFLPKDEYPIMFLANLVIEHVSAIPICPTCKKVPLRFLKSKGRFQHHCCPSCAAKDPITIERLETTNMTRHGCKHYNNHAKQEHTMMERHGMKSALCKSSFREKGMETKERKYGSRTFNNPEKATRTSKERYGTGRNNQKVEETMEKRYGHKTYLLSDEINRMRNCPEIQRKISIRKKKNHTFNTSMSEEECYSILVERFGQEDVCRQFSSELYPFNCDFYVPSLDLYIEFNGNWTHGRHPFDESNEDDIKTVAKWKERGGKFYELAIHTWTIRDVNKRETAKKNGINYVEFWSVDDLRTCVNKLNEEMTDEANNCKERTTSH